jgi:hypothetical protein
MCKYVCGLTYDWNFIFRCAFNGHYTSNAVAIGVTMVMSMEEYILSYIILLNIETSNIK